jgi:hypothetical protein
MVQPARQKRQPRDALDKESYGWFTWLAVFVRR